MGKIIFEFSKKDEKSHVSVNVEGMEPFSVQDVVSWIIDYAVNTLSWVEKKEDMLVSCVAMNDVFSSKISAVVADRLKKEKVEKKEKKTTKKKVKRVVK